MNGKKAKALRRKIYGNKSQRAERQYVGGKLGKYPRGYVPTTITNAPSSPRAEYQAAKRATGKWAILS